MKYECIAMLYYLGVEGQVMDQYIRFILDKQLDNGMWSASGNTSTESNALPSALNCGCCLSITAETGIKSTAKYFLQFPSFILQGILPVIVV